MRPHTKEAYRPGQETNWFIHVMTFLVTQEVSLMALVSFPNSLSSLGNAVLAFRARKQWYLSLNEQGLIPYECELFFSHLGFICLTTKCRLRKKEFGGESDTQGQSM